MYPAFELAYINGHENFADYIYRLYYLWENKIFQDLPLSRDWPSDYLKHWQKILNRTYLLWNSIDEYYSQNPNDFSLYKVREKKFKTSLKFAIIDNDLEKAKKILKEFNTFPLLPHLSDALSYCGSKLVLKELLRESKKLESNYSISNVFLLALKNRNYELAKELATKVKMVDLSYVLSIASSYSVDYAKIYILPKLYDKSWPEKIGSKYLLYEILNGLKFGKFSENSEDANVRIILSSSEAFSKNPHEYINLINSYIGCIHNYELQSVNAIIVRGDFYMAAVFLNEITICTKENIDKLRKRGTN